MTLQDDFRGLAESIRGMAADFGVRPYSVAVRVTSWSGGAPGRGVRAMTTTPILEAGANPKVSFPTTEEVFANDGAIEVAEVGPVTPDHPDGGTPLSTLVPSMTSAEEVAYILTGPRYPDGAEFKLVELKHHRGYQYRIVLRRTT